MNDEFKAEVERAIAIQRAVDKKMAEGARKKSLSEHPLFIALVSTLTALALFMLNAHAEREQTSAANMRSALQAQFDRKKEMSGRFVEEFEKGLTFLANLRVAGAELKLHRAQAQGDSEKTATNEELRTRKEVASRLEKRYDSFASQFLSGPSLLAAIMRAKGEFASNSVKDELSNLTLVVKSLQDLKDYTVRRDPQPITTKSEVERVVTKARDSYERVAVAMSEEILFLQEQLASGQKMPIQQGNGSVKGGAESGSAASKR